MHTTDRSTATLNQTTDLLRQDHLLGLVMNIYFACSITGGRKEEKVYQLIVNTLISDGHVVPTAHLSQPDVLLLEDIVEPEDVYTRDIEWIDNCQALIAEVSTPSHGVGFEISYALSIEKPVLCLHRQGVRISKMLSGNSHPRIQIRAYQDEGDIVSIIRDFTISMDRVNDSGVMSNIT